MDKNFEKCLPSSTGEHEWRPYLSGGYICVYCGQQWVPVEPCVDPDEIEAHKQQKENLPKSGWPEIIGAIVGALLALIVLLLPLAR